jgi:hypothetical protein
MWVYKGEPVVEPAADHFSFVYLITNLVTGRKYIGKKLFWFAKTKMVKGKKKKYKVESDWKEYWSSSEELKADVAQLGEHNFTREILYYCTNKGTASYIEAREQFDRRVLERPEEYYNGIINLRCHRKHLKLPDTL